MKKFLSKIMFATVAILSVAGFTSCNNNDNDDPYVPKPDTAQYGKAIVKVSESIFQYATATLVLEYDGQSVSYPLDEKTKVAKDADMLETFGEENAAARVIDVPVFTFKSAPVKGYIKYELTDAGKKKIAEEPTGKANLYYLTFFGKCKADGSGQIDWQRGGNGGIKHAGLELMLKNESAMSYYIK